MLAQHASPVSVSSPAARLVAPAVRIDVYDGPLELLLFLVRREGVDVRDIPVARICDAYLAFLGDAATVDVDAAGDYLLMAATLCHLKARDLLPRAHVEAAGEEEADPREALIRRLQEYERFKAAAEELGARERLDRDVFARPAEAPAVDEQPIDPTTDAFGLVRAFYALLDRRAAPAHVHRVHRERYRLIDTVRWVLRRLGGVGEALLSDLFVDLPSRPRRVFTFLGILEMARHQMLDVLQESHLGAIRLCPRVSAEDADYSRFAQDDEEPPDAEGDA